MNSKIALALGVVVGLAAGYFLFGNHANGSQAELAQLRAATNTLGVALANARKGQLTDEDLEKLEATHRDGIKMRGEIANLKQQLSNAVASANSAQKAADAAQSAMNRARDQAKAAEEQTAGEMVTPRTFTSNAAAMMTPGQSLVVGGWPTGTGTVTYAFLSPTIADQANNQILVSGKMVEIPEEAATQLRLMNGQGGGALTLSPEQVNTMMATWQQTPGFKVLSSPRVMTSSGVTGSVSMGQMMRTANGQVHFGQEYQVTPTLAPDGSRVQLNVDAKLTVPDKGTGQP